MKLKEMRSMIVIVIFISIWTLASSGKQLDSAIYRRTFILSICFLILDIENELKRFMLLLNNFTWLREAAIWGLKL